MEEKFSFVTLADLRTFMQEWTGAAASKKQAPENDLLTGKEVRGIFNISTCTLWKWKKQGLLNPVQVGGKNLYYKRAEVERLKAGNV